VKASETAVYTPGSSTRLDLAVTSGIDFSADVTSGVVPLTVRFTDKSIGDPRFWSWDFGDGATSTLQHPVHTYTIPGNYTVRLSVDDGLSNATKPNYIKVTPVLFGDANGDGRVDQADTLLVLHYVVGLAEKPGAGTERFELIDVHRNGVIEVGDALFIAQHNVGLRDVWFGLQR
jgi:PKD repeat protein